MSDYEPQPTPHLIRESQGLISAQDQAKARLRDNVAILRGPCPPFDIWELAKTCGLHDLRKLRELDDEQLHLICEAAKVGIADALLASDGVPH